MPPEPEPIHAAFLAENEPMASAMSPASFLWMGVGYLLLNALLFIFRALALSTAVMTGIAIGIGLIALAFTLRSVIRSRRIRWARARDGLKSDPSMRLRLVGDGAQTASLIENLADVAFEPFVVFSWFGVSFLSPASPDVPSKPRTPQAPPSIDSGLAPAQHALMWVLGSMFLAAFLLLPWLAMNRRWEFNPVQIMASAGLSAFVVAIISPTYVRIAPGVLDVLRFGWRPADVVTFDRWDLRTARILADQRSGIVRICDDSRPQRRTVLLRAGQLMCTKRSLISTVLIAARTRHPTPPLPPDALIG